MKKQILFTCALLLFSKSIAMNTETKWATVTIKFTKEGYKEDKKEYKGLSNIIRAKVREQGLSEQEIKTCYLCNSGQQIHGQLPETNMSSEEIFNIFDNKGISPLLKVHSPLSLEITYKSDIKGKNIKKAKK